MPISRDRMHETNVPVPVHILLYLEQIHRRERPDADIGAVAHAIQASLTAAIVDRYGAAAEQAARRRDEIDAAAHPGAVGP